MHELGVVFHMIDTLKSVAAANEVTAIARVTLDLGEVSSVIPDYLQDCWKWAIKKEPLLTDAELNIQIVPGINLCEECGEQYRAVDYGRTCPRCGSGRTHLLQGNEFTIREIEVPEEEEEHG